MTWRDHIVVDPAICYGKPNIKETQVMVSVVLDNIEAGDLSKNLNHRTLGRLAKYTHVAIQPPQSVRQTRANPILNRSDL